MSKKEKGTAMTKIETLRAAEALAKVFLARVKKYNTTIDGSCRLPEGRDHAAVLRASLDLSLALADLRQGR